mgnify:FL=1
MSLLKSKTLNNINKNNFLNNINSYYIKIDYYDDKGKKKYINKVPFKYILDINNNLHQDKNYV